MQQQLRKLMQQQFRKLMQQHTGSETAVQGREPEFNLKNTHTHTAWGDVAQSAQMIGGAVCAE
jgi:hypothetical protein